MNVRVRPCDPDTGATDPGLDHFWVASLREDLGNVDVEEYDVGLDHVLAGHQVVLDVVEVVHLELAVVDRLVVLRARRRAARVHSGRLSGRRLRLLRLYRCSRSHAR